MKIGRGCGSERKKLRKTIKTEWNLKVKGVDFCRVHAGVYWSCAKLKDEKRNRDFKSVDGMTHWIWNASGQNTGEKVFQMCP